MGLGSKGRKSFLPVLPSQYLGESPLGPLISAKRGQLSNRWGKVSEGTQQDSQAF